MIVLGIFFIISHRKRSDGGAGVQSQGAGYQPGTDTYPMEGTGVSPPVGYGPPSDYRGSMFKPNETSPMGSPPTSPMPYQGGNISPAPYPSPGQTGTQPPSYPEQRYELPNERGDGQVQELHA